jgi:hypothetical protein
MANIYLCNDFAGAYPVGTAAVVVARNERTARKLLDAELVKRHLVQHAPFTLTLLDDEKEAVLILNDGTY